MSTLASFLAALALSLTLAFHPLDWVAWLASVAWATALYGVHEWMTDTHGRSAATVVVVVLGSLVALFVGVAVDNSLAALMAGVCVATSLWLRDIYPRFFQTPVPQPVEP